MRLTTAAHECIISGFMWTVIGLCVRAQAHRHAHTQVHTLLHPEHSHPHIQTILTATLQVNLDLPAASILNYPLPFIPRLCILLEQTLKLFISI